MSVGHADTGHADGEQACAHPGLAEQGKLHALAGEHELALLYYRHAMRLAVSAGAPEAFFRHYLECTMESLELMGSYEAVLDYCERVDRHYEDVVPNDARQAQFVARDRAANAQRRAAVLAKLHRHDEACAWCAEARERAASAGSDVPLALVLQRWLGRGLHIEPDRVVAEQRRLCYFSVTEASVERARAVRLPPELLTPGAA